MERRGRVVSGFFHESQWLWRGGLWEGFFGSSVRGQGRPRGGRHWRVEGRSSGCTHARCLCRVTRRRADGSVSGVGHTSEAVCVGETHLTEGDVYDPSRDCGPGSCLIQCPGWVWVAPSTPRRRVRGAKVKLSVGYTETTRRDSPPSRVPTGERTYGEG